MFSTTIISASVILLIGLLVGVIGIVSTTGISLLFAVFSNKFCLQHKFFYSKTIIMS